VKIIRVFPRKTKATPDDEGVRFGVPGMFDEADEIHVSVAFTWDLPRAVWLAKQWEHIAPVKIGGPATGERGGSFTPGMYLKHGYVITSRGCPNHCWFCSVPKREGDIRELPITEGWHIQDDNLLACSYDHILAVFEMLERQKNHVEFSGGFEAARLTWWMALHLKKINPKQIFFAYDTPEELEPLRAARITLRNAGFPEKSHTMRAFVLCGYPKDTMSHAETRMKETMDAGFTPMAMLWKDETGKQDKEWRKFQREWARPAIIHARKY
jgi:hypothetical protein